MNLAKANMIFEFCVILQLKLEGIQSDIDHQLYAKYGLSEEEVAFIEGMIKGCKLRNNLINK